MIIFSKIKANAKSGGDIYKGLVSGIPYNLTDLEGWKDFELFLAGLDDDFVEVEVQVFGYGEGETVQATPEEVAYMYMRLKMRPDFLETRCNKLSTHTFNFDWTPSELFN